MANEVQNPPVFDDETNYDNWIKDLEIWELFTTTALNKRGPRLYLSLKGKARDLARELTGGEIGSETGVQKIVDKLNGHYQKDKVQQAYIKLENFENFMRPSKMSIADYITEFEKLNNEVKKCEMDGDGVMAYKLLHHANLSETEVNLIKATMTRLSYNEIKEKLQRIFNDMTSKPSVKSESAIKVESTFYAENEPEEAYYTNNYSQVRGRPRGRYRGESSRGDNYRARGNNMSNYNRGQNMNYRGGTRKLNPPDETGEASKCAICGSCFHWARNCPDAYENQSGYNKGKPVHFNYDEGSQDNQKEENNTRFPMFISQKDTTEIHIFKSDEVNHKKELDIFLGESLSSAVIDSGAPDTVTGTAWLEDFMNKLTDEEKMLVTRKSSHKSYKFGDMPAVTSKETISLPMTIASREVMLTTDVVDVNVPLLMSKNALKKAGAVIDFKEDTIQIFGTTENLLESSSGHYMIPVHNNIDMKVKPTIMTHLINPQEDPKKTAHKIHRHFSHANKKRLQKLLEDAELWSDEMSQALTDVENKCQTCKRYSKPYSRPVVGFSSSKSFNDIIAMDLKDHTHNGKTRKLLHIVDHNTRFGQCIQVSSKTKEEILEKLFKAWIQVFGPPNKILTDNGGEFLNNDFMEMSDKLGIKIKMTAAESPFSNGLVERHNAVLSDTLYKTLEEISNFDLALAWAVQAKNSLYNFHGFSPFILVFGKNPKIPTTIDSSLPTLENRTTSEILAENLNAMNAARQNFLKSESEEKVKRALRRNVSGAVDHKYFDGDRVYIKKRKQNMWSGPGTVVGQEYQQILVRIGGYYYRVHPCHIILEEESNKEIVKGLKDEEKPGELQVSESPEVEFEVTETDEVQDAVEVENEAHPEPQNEPENLEVNTRRLRYPREGIDIKYKTSNSRGWLVGKVEGRPDQYRNNHIFNIKQRDNEDIKQVDFKNEVIEWKHILDENWEVEVTEETYICSNRERDEINKAKEEEINKWKKNDVYHEVQDTGQERISVKWILKEKNKDGKMKYKARLVARGFEEIEQSRSDSPTCMKDNIRIMLGIAASMSWECNVMDIAGAFLQGNKVHREIFLKPPAEVRKPGILWKLHKCVYGLSDASRMWYLKVKDELIKLGAQTFGVDPAFFFWKHEGELYGILSSHVDDFLNVGEKSFENRVMRKLKDTFEISSEARGDFAYIGINLTSNNHSFYLDQLGYINEIKPIPLSEVRRLNKDDEVTESERTQLRSIIGKLNWVTTQTRPDLSFEVSRLASKVNKAKVHNIVEINKVVKKAKSEEVVLRFPKLKNIKECKIIVYSDASFGNAEAGGSQGAHLIFLADSEYNSAIISWSSTRMKRVVRSTLSAETLALSDAVDKARFINKILSRLLLKEGEKFPVICLTDSRSIAQSVRTTHTLTEKLLMVDMAALREAVDAEEIEIQWIETKDNLANPLTKKTAYSGSLIQTLCSGHL